MLKKPEYTISDFQAALSSIGARYPTLKMDDLFVLWFLRAYITKSEDIAIGSLTGNTKEKGIDALLIDEKLKTVIVVQGKYRNSLGQKNEKRADVICLSEVAAQLSSQDDSNFQSYIHKMDSLTADKLCDARKRVVEDDYKIWLLFATLGKVSHAISKDAESHLNSLQSSSRIEVIDFARMRNLLRNYNDDVAPPIPSLDLEMEEGDQVRVNSVLWRYDEKNQIESWVFTMRGDRIAEIFKYAGRQLFARNVRGFLGLGGQGNRV